LILGHKKMKLKWGIARIKNGGDGEIRTDI